MLSTTFTILKPTRFSNVAGESPSLLDHIWVNSVDNFTSGVACFDNTDHLPVLIFYPFSIPSDPNVEKIRISFRNKSISNKQFDNN